MMNPFMVEKQERLEQTKKIMKNNQGCDITKAIALLVINFGISEKTSKQYIKTLKDFDYLEIKEGRIYVN